MWGWAVWSLAPSVAKVNYGLPIQSMANHRPGRHWCGVLRWSVEENPTIWCRKKKKKRFAMGVKVDVMSGFSPLSLSLNVTEYSLLCLYKSVRFLRIYPARVLNMILSRFYSIYLSDRLTYCCRTTVPLCVTLWSFSLLFSCGNILVLILLLLID